jgi:hypothetical protein
MNKKFLSVVSWSLLILFFGCDINSPTSSSQQLNPDAGQLSAHLDLANEYVTASNKDSAGTAILGSIHMPSTMIRNSKLFGSYESYSSDTTISIDSTFKIDGENSGYAQIKQTGTITMNMTTEEGKINYSASITYFDFSNDGKVFIGGEGQCTLNANYSSDVQSMSVTHVGHIKFNGLYIGECKYNMSVELNDDQVSYSGDMKIISNGEEYTYDITEIK